MVISILLSHSFSSFGILSILEPMNIITKIKNYYNWGGRYLTDPYHIKGHSLNKMEASKKPQRFDIINYLLASLKRETVYLEIGVRNPAINFDKINANKKYSVDPGLEYEENPVDFKLTSDAFFDGLRSGTILKKDMVFDVIFIDGLHLAEQVVRDIFNARDFIKEDGFIVLHDCNPPSEWHAREEHKYEISPAMYDWNGTTWKAFYKWRQRMPHNICCIDTDWGVGIISKNKVLSQDIPPENPFYEFNVLHKHRKQAFGLVSFEEFKSKLN